MYDFKCIITSDTERPNGFLQNLREIYSDIYESLDENNIGSNYNTLGGIQVILGNIFWAIDSLNCKDKKAIYHYSENVRNLEIIYSDKYEDHKNEIGIIITKAPSTHFNKHNYFEPEYLEGAEQVLKQTSKHFLKIFTNSEKNKLFIFTNQELELETIYKLNVLKWTIIKDAADDFYEETLDFYNGFVNKDIDLVNDAFNKLMSLEKIEENKNRKLKKCFSFDYEMQITRFESEIHNKYADIQNYENIIAKLGSDIRNINERIRSLNNIDLDEEFDILTKYLKKHPYIYKVIPMEGSSKIILYFYSPIIYFEKDMVEKLLSNTYENLIDYKIVYNMFLSGKYTLYTHCNIAFNTRTFETETMSEVGNEKYIAHPHIMRYNCFGNHRQAISESAETRDYLGAIEQISQAIMNLNFYDSVVEGELMRNLTGDERNTPTWKNNETGEIISTDEAIKEVLNGKTESNE